MNIRKITSAILAAGLALGISAAAYAAEIPIERLGGSVSISEDIADIVKSRSVNNTLVIEQGQTVYIPSGVKLTLKAGAVIKGNLGQHRTKTIFWILHTSCLHLLRHIAQFVLARRQPCVVLIVQSDEKSDCAIRVQSLCGIALISQIKKGE